MPSVARGAAKLGACGFHALLPPLSSLRAQGVEYGEVLAWGMKLLVLAIPIWGGTIEIKVHAIDLTVLWDVWQHLLTQLFNLDL